ncbi:hypothetical protein LCGC14_2904230, partial [marine sediment metagenome]
MKPVGVNAGQLEVTEDMIYADFPDWDTDTDWIKTQRAFAGQWSRAVCLNKNEAITFGSLAADASKWYGGVLAPNGMIYGIPRTATTVLKIDPSDDTTSPFGSLAGSQKWLGGVLGVDGMIYGIPFDSTTILKIDPTTDTASTFDSFAG